MNRIITYIVEWLSVDEAIRCDEKELYEYAVSELLRIVIPVTFAMLIGIVLMHPLRTIIIYISFSLVRKFCGGFHFNNSKVCFAFSTAILVGLTILSEYKLDDVMICIILPLATVSLVVGKTVDHANRRLTKQEKRLCKRYTIIIILAELFAVFVLWNCRQNSIAICISLGISLAAILRIIPGTIYIVSKLWHLMSFRKNVLE